MNKELDIIDVEFCYNCKSKQKRSGNSLHCWDIEYECGCKIWGAIDDKRILLDKECPNKNK